MAVVRIPVKVMWDEAGRRAVIKKADAAAYRRMGWTDEPPPPPPPYICVPVWQCKPAHPSARFTVVTPSLRTGDLPVLQRHLETAGVQWIIVTDEHNRGKVPTGSWIRTLFVTVPRGENPCYWKLNQVLASCIEDETRHYMVLCDDTLYAPDFFERLGTPREDLIMFTVDRRGRKLRRKDAPTIHPTEPIIASAQNFWINNIYLDAIAVRGSIAKKCRYPTDCTNADGYFALSAAAEVALAGGRIGYRPECVVRFNVLERGRLDECPCLLADAPDWQI